jgi:protein SCO1
MVRATGLALLLSTLVACTAAPVDRVESTARTGRFPLTGTVLGLERATGRVTIGHDAVKDVMPAMAMSFKVEHLGPDVHVGDRVTATLVVTSERSWVEDLTAAAKIGTPAGDMASASAGSALGVGDAVPDVRLRNQDDQPVSLGQFRGQVVLVTFIYTRCPLPDFCPLMMRNFGAVKRELVDRADVWSRVRLLSVTIDPEHDTPAVLRAYGRAMIRDPNPFDRWDLATGSAGDIRGMAASFGVTSSTTDRAITHTLRTVLIGADGRVAAIWPDNSWRTADVVAVVTRETGREK